VGPPSPQHTFLVHKNTICNKSPFFAAAFDNGNFIKGQTQAMSLEDIEGEVFGLSIELIYTDKIKDPYETPYAPCQGLDPGRTISDACTSKCDHVLSRNLTPEALQRKG
jgi:hypothetical protein